MFNLLVLRDFCAVCTYISMNLLIIKVYTVFCILLINVYVYSSLFIIMIDYLTNNHRTNNSINKHKPYSYRNNKPYLI